MDRQSTSGDGMMTANKAEERDERITNEVIVDAYTPEEQALG
jgi:hypothetical protein